MASWYHWHDNIWSALRSIPFHSHPLMLYGSTRHPPFFKLEMSHRNPPQTRSMSELASCPHLNLRLSYQSNDGWSDAQTMESLLEHYSNCGRKKPSTKNKNKKLYSCVSRRALGYRKRRHETVRKDQHISKVNSPKTVAPHFVLKTTHLQA